MIWSPSESAGSTAAGVGGRDSAAPSPRPSSAAAEGHAILLAAVAWIAADAAPSVALPITTLAAGIAATGLALIGRRPLVLVLGVGLMCAHLGARAEAAYRPLPPGPMAGPATVVGDPRPAGQGWAIQLRLSTGDRVEATAFGRSGAVLSGVSIGHRLAVEGAILPVGDRPWLAARHVTARLTVDRAEIIAHPGPIHRLPGAVRSRIVDGAATMSDRQRALYLGLVIGDDRFQPPGQRLEFRAAGLSHLLAVSGQNVAFVVVVVRPLLLLLGYRGRFVVLAAVLVLFAMVTRGEPSVLRATATALLAAWAALTGRERSGLRVLGVAVTSLVMIDPFLVDVVGFQLSVAASAGILVAGPLIERRLPGPAWLRSPLALTLSAQLAVSPILAAHFGPVPLAAVPANFLAGWAAAAIMTIGLTVGLMAGLAPHPAAVVVQLPARALLWWIESVADVSARLPAPRMGPVALVVFVVAVLVAVKGGSAGRRLGGALVALVVAAPAIPTAPGSPVECGTDLSWYPPRGGGPAVVVVGSAATVGSVEGCFEAGVTGADVALIESGGARSARVVAAMTDVMVIRAVLAPRQHRVVGATPLLEPRRIATAWGTIQVRPDADRRRLLIDRPSLGPS